MRDVNEMLLFAGVVQHGSYSAAARATGVPKATISRKVADLEARLGVRLLQRTTRRVTPTEAGIAFNSHCRRIIDEVEAAEAAAEHHQASPTGVLRIGAPFAIANRLLAPLLPGFLTSHPEVVVDLSVSNDPIDVLERGVDVVVTGRPAPESSFPVRRLFRLPTAPYAAPSYLARRRTPTVPEDLAGHRTLLLRTTDQPTSNRWTLVKGDRKVTVPIQPVLVSNDYLPLLDAAVAGLGILLTVDPGVLPAAAPAPLVRVLPGWNGPLVEARAIFPNRQAMPPKVRAFLDYLARFAERMRGPSLRAAP